jgi:SAM-dependent methyltransferase
VARAAVRAGRIRDARDLLLTPVSIVRYWEFPFVRRHISARPGVCLDVASPHLFSCYVGKRLAPSSIRIINPDRRDADQTRALALALGLQSVEVLAEPVAAMRGTREAYDTIWSISVLEHIADDGDVEAMGILWAALRPGGRLVITVPVDRTAWDEYRDQDVYDLGLDERGGRYFFQRWYDEAALHARLIGGAAGADISIEWFGEKVPDTFAAYEQDWIRLGHTVTVEDPLLIARDWQAYPYWASMPGQGVAGICLEKPA